MKAVTESSGFLGDSWVKMEMLHLCFLIGFAPNLQLHRLEQPAAIGWNNLQPSFITGTRDSAVRKSRLLNPIGDVGTVQDK